jgi:hypothetical protein
MLQSGQLLRLPEFELMLLFKTFGLLLLEFGLPIPIPDLNQLLLLVDFGAQSDVETWCDLAVVRIWYHALLLLKFDVLLFLLRNFRIAAVIVT